MKNLPLVSPLHGVAYVATAGASYALWGPIGLLGAVIGVVSTVGGILVTLLAFRALAEAVKHQKRGPGALLFYTLAFLKLPIWLMAATICGLVGKPCVYAYLVAISVVYSALLGWGLSAARAP